VEVTNINDYMKKYIKEIDEKLEKQTMDNLNQLMSGRYIWYSARSRATAALIISSVTLILNVAAAVAILWCYI